MIEVSADDSKKPNAAIIRILLALHEADGSLPTRKLYESAHMNTTYGARMIITAENLGYVKRESVSKAAGHKGNRQMINTLTDRGRELLERLQLA